MRKFRPPLGSPPAKLPFDLSQLPILLARYREMTSALHKSDDTIAPVVQRVKSRGHMSPDEAVVFAAWKLGWSQGAHWITKNTVSPLRDATAKALKCDNAPEALSELRKLSGFATRTASAFLHLFHSKPFPIIDVEVMRAFGLPPNSVPITSYSERELQEFYFKYVPVFRKWTLFYELSGRDIDRALWVLGSDSLST